MLDNQILYLQKIIGGQNVSRETFLALNQFSDLLLKWNNKINLVSKKITPQELWERHILDSAQLIKYLPEHKCRIVDFGSGAGFPALIIAIVGGHEVTVVESDQRKCAFMQEAAVQLKLSIKIINSRIEDVRDIHCDIITARALAPLTKLMEYSENILQENNFMLFLKGQNVVEEIKEASISWDFRHELFPSALNDEGKVIKISNLRRL